jgi:hypothetical protein
VLQCEAVAEADSREEAGESAVEMPGQGTRNVGSFQRSVRVKGWSGKLLF